MQAVSVSYDDAQTQTVKDLSSPKTPADFMHFSDSQQVDSRQASSDLSEFDHNPIVTRPPVIDRDPVQSLGPATINAKFTY